MLKVICIDDNWTTQRGFHQTSGDPVYGNIYTVTNAFSDKYGEWYTLKEMDSSDEFTQDGFAPISEIDETTFERNYNKELV